jgi:hypothetical protein
MSSYECRAPSVAAGSLAILAVRHSELDTRNYAEWELSRERQTHEWKRVRRAIITTRIRLVVFGHLLFFAGCILVNLLGSPDVSKHFTHIGWYSLLLTSSSLLLAEWMHVRFPPRSPPRYVVRSTGVTEYGDEGPRHHLDWSRTRQLRLISDRERPEFHSLVFVLGGQSWLAPQHRISVPLPQPVSQSSLEPIGEFQALEAIGSALTENGFDWKSFTNHNDVELTFG